jgi:hypothetical protein
MKFLHKNIAMIVSLVLAYAIINYTAEYLPNVIYTISGMRVEEGFFSKYRFPVFIVAILIFPIIRGLHNKLKS